MTLRAIFWWHFAVVALFAAFACLDSSRGIWYGKYPWLTAATELPIFHAFIGVLAIVAILSLIICPIAVLVIVGKSKNSSAGWVAALTAEVLLIVVQVIAIIPTIQ